MQVFDIVAAILSLTAALAYVNRRLLRLPETIGVMVLSIAASLVILAIGNGIPGSLDGLCHRVMEIDFSFFVLEIALGFLIFAGAFGTNTRTLAAERIPVLLFATVGLVVSTFLVGGLSYVLLGALGLDTPFLHCLLFGALISPTDPVAVLAILKTSCIAPELEADVAGESLLNDGVAVVIFLTILHLVEGGAEAHVSATDVGQLLVSEVGVGVLLGGAVGALGLYLLRTARSAAVDILVTLSVVMGGYALAGALHASGPLAMVVAGLIASAGVAGRGLDASEREHVEVFWETLDESFNAVLFVLLGLVLLGLADDFEPIYLAAGVLAIPVVLLSRLVSVALSIALTGLRRRAPVRTATLLTWGGLRGGISVALALSLEPEGMSRALIVHMTYVVVVFSVLAQGLTVKPLVARLGLAQSRESAAS